MRLLFLAALTVLAYAFLLSANPEGRPPAAAPIDQSEPMPTDKPNVHFRDARLKDAFRDWLAVRNVPHRVYYMKGKEYVVWDGPENLAYEFMTGGKEAWK